MNKNWWRLILILASGVWITTALYGLIFNITYIDEAKYLIKGWLILTGQISYYHTPQFFYQHMPGILLWYGLGQKIFGPSLLAGRAQSLLTGLLVFWGSFLLGRRLGGEKTGLITLALLSLSPVVTLYYSAAVPQSLIVLILILGFIYLYDGLVKKSLFKFLLASVFFSLAFVVRENFLFTLILYLGFLIIVFKNNLKFLFKNLIVILITLGIFIVPGYPGTIDILKNFPGVSYLLPVSLAEKQILSLYWKGGIFSLGLYFRAIREFGVIFHAWILIWGLIGLNWLKKSQKNWKLKSKAERNFWLFLITITGFNFLIHDLAAFKLSPRAIVSYFSYIAPLVTVIMAKMITPWLNTKKSQQKALAIYLFLLILSPIGLRFAAILGMPSRQPDLRTTYESAGKLKVIMKDKPKILWLAEPMSLYLAGRISFYPLINHTGFYKLSPDTKTVRQLGFWNQTMLNQWLNEADTVVVETNKLDLLKESPDGKDLAEDLEKTLSQNFKLVETRSDLWPGELSFYKPKP